jgi:hypothetical protein
MSMVTQYRLSRTQAQLKDLGYPDIGIEFKDGSKHFGKVSKFTRDTIYFIDRNGDELDAPRRLIQRAFLLLKGEELDGQPVKVFRQHKSQG